MNVLLLFGDHSICYHFIREDILRLFSNITTTILVDPELYPANIVADVLSLRNITYKHIATLKFFGFDDTVGIVPYYFEDKPVNFSLGFIAKHPRMYETNDFSMCLSEHRYDAHFKILCRFESWEMLFDTFKINNNTDLKIIQESAIDPALFAPRLSKDISWNKYPDMNKYVISRLARTYNYSISTIVKLFIISANPFALTIKHKVANEFDMEEINKIFYEIDLGLDAMNRITDYLAVAPIIKN